MEVIKKKNYTKLMEIYFSLVSSGTYMVYTVPAPQRGTLQILINFFSDMTNMLICMPNYKYFRWDENSQVGKYELNFFKC